MKHLSAFIFSLFIFSSGIAQVPGACNTGSGGKGVTIMNGNASLGGPTYSKSACGLNFVHVDKLIETRFNQYTTATPPYLGSGLPTTLTVSGLPNCLTIDKAYIYYWVSYLSAAPPVSSVDLTNPTPSTANYPAVMIGQDQGKCWGETGTANYRADVTAAITGNGNYGLNILGITGAPSGNFANNYDEIDGASLIIIYKDNSATYQGSMILWDGDMTGVGNTYTQTMTGINACAAGINAVAFNLVSDMQDNVGPTHPATLNGVVSTPPNSFWCWDQANTTVTSGQATAAFGEDGQGSDCFDWGLMGLYYQTTTCTTCVPSAVSLTVTPTNSTCNAPNGSAAATATTSNPPLTYSWAPGGQTTTSISNLAAGTYTCTVTSATGCSTVQSFTIATSMGPNVTFTATPTKCFGSSDGSATLTASGGTAPYTYGWITAPAQTTPTATGLAAGTYSVSVGDASGCSSTYTVAVTQPTAMAATASVVANASCNGSSDGSAIANGTGGTGAYTYGWTPTGQNTQTASGLPAGSYNVVVTDANGCTAPSSAPITQPTAVTITQSSTAASCGISDGTATASGGGGIGPYTYLWLTTPVQTQPTAVNLSGGVYTILVTDANGCTSQMQVTVAGGLPPSAEFMNDPDTVNLMDASIQFTDLSTSAFTWTWDFGDPNSSSNNSVLQDPKHTYSDTGVYCIRLVVTDPGGVCRDTVVHCIKVEAPYTFYIPNAFTPNSDGYNELFYGKGTYIKNFKMWLFDRWGNLIFSCDVNGEPQNFNDCKWDGKVKRQSDLVEEDVYVWKVNIIDANDKKHNYIGRVTMAK